MAKGKSNVNSKVSSRGKSGSGGKKVTRADFGANVTRLIRFNRVEIEELLEERAGEYSRRLDRDRNSLYDYLFDHYSPDYGRLIFDIVQHFNDEKFSSYSRMQLVVYGPRLFDVNFEENSLVEVTPWRFRYGMLEFSRDFSGMWDVTTVTQVGDDPQELLYDYLYSKPNRLIDEELYSPAKLHVMLTNQKEGEWTLNRETIFHNKFGADRYFGWAIDDVELRPEDGELGKKLPYLEKGFDVFLEGLNRYIDVMISSNPSLRFKNSDLVLSAGDYHDLIAGAGSIADQFFSSCGDGYHKLTFRYYDELLEREGRKSFEWNKNLGVFSTNSENIDQFIYASAAYCGLLDVSNCLLVLQSFSKVGKTVSMWSIDLKNIGILTVSEIENERKNGGYKPLQGFEFKVDTNYQPQ